MFLITTSTVVNASACDMKLNSPGRLQNEANHTVDDIHGVRAFVAFDRPLKISKIEFYKHEQL